MLNAEKTKVTTRLKQEKMMPPAPPVFVTIDDVKSDKQLDLPIDVARGEDNALSFETIVLEFRAG